MSLFRLDNRVALVTGASRGLGAAMAAALEEAGASVIRHARSQPAHAAGYLVADLLNRAETDRMVAESIDACGRIDILVNNAGFIRRTPAASYSDDDWDAVIEGDLTSMFRICRTVGAHMLERGSGRIVNIASLLSFQGGITVPAYAAAKGGVAQLTKALANEWAGKGVNVNAIAPGYMRTANTDALANDAVRNRQILERIPAGRWGEPTDLAGPVVFLASDAARYVHGHILVVDGGWMGR